MRLFLIILACGLITYGMRLLPFLVFDPKRGIPPLIKVLGEKLPPAVMATLVVYCLKDIYVLAQAGDFYGMRPFIAGALATVVTQIFGKNSILSIIIGTLVYMIFLRVI